ncbi:MAG: ETC complex I subunit [Rhodobacterales bacterium]|nr:MAG: ETC complex I subunit [Rhodobacterales bacterium]
MRARLYSPAKTAMSSGMAKTHGWVLDFEPDGEKVVDPLMGWTGSSDMHRQVKLRFETRAAAEDYAREHGIEVIAVEPTRRKPNIRQGGYGDNFAYSRRKAWTH